MKLAAAEIAKQLSGTVHGDENAIVTDVCSLDQPAPGRLSFLVNAGEHKKLANTSATIVLIADDCDICTISSSASALIKVSDPFAAFMAMIAIFRPLDAGLPNQISPQADVHESAVIGRDVQISANSSIGPGCRIGDRCRIHPGVTLGANVQLGDDVVLYPNAVVYAGCRLENRVVIHAGSVIGADGFGYRFSAGQFHKLPHYGRVIIEQDVEIGASTTIDRGMIDDTVIGRGTKIDNQVMIAHNCRIGPHNVIVSQVGMAGSVTTGEYCRFGGQAGVADHVTIGAGTSLSAHTGAFRDIGPGETVGGSPAMPMSEQKKIIMAMIKLPELRQTVRQLKKQMDRIEQESAPTADDNTVVPLVQKAA